MFCPKCKAEYREGFYTCSDCNAELVHELPLESSKEQTIPRLKQIFSAIYSPEANLVKSILEGGNLHPVIHDEHIVQWQPLYSYAIGGIKVLVPEEEFERAQEIMHGYFKDRKTIDHKRPKTKTDKQERKVRCYTCGSTDLIKRWDLGKVYFFIYCLSIIGLVILLFTPRRYTCLECGSQWRE